MERRKLYNRVPARLPSTTRWRYANSVCEQGSVSLEDSLSFAEALLSNEASHVEGGDDIDSYFEEPNTLTDDENLAFVEDLLQQSMDGVSTDSESSCDDSLLEFAQDLLCSFGNSDENGGSDGESSDEFTDNILRFFVDDESDTELQFSPGMLLESHSYLPFDEQMDVETDESHLTPLYENAPLSVAASWQAIMGFSLANHLPYTAMAQLLNLLKMHVPSTHGLPKSLNSFKKHFIIDEAQPQQRFCSHCFKKLKSEEKHCSRRSCRDNKADLCYFVSVPITVHLKQIVEDCWSLLQYPFTRERNGNICDIQDGESYKRDPFFAAPEHVGVIMNIDGIKVFTSSKFTLWPVFLSITSLPPHLRMNKDYILLAGVWFGPQKPPPTIILTSALEELQHLHAVGLDVSTPEGIKQIRVKLLLTVCDLPAKAMVLNQKQYNGFYSCNFCLDKGVHINHRMLYLPTEAHIPRTHTDIQRCAQEAETTGQTIYGIKGVSILTEYTDLVNGIPIDYMHAVLEGITKALMTYWFEPQYSRKSFSLSRHLKEIDKKLVSIKPPHEFRRSPRSISTSRKFWKASEYRAWLLFYSLPIAGPYLPAEYAHHYSLLVYALHILLGSSISPHDLDIANELLLCFYQHMPEFYGDTSCLINVHNLIHLVPLVKQWGPLWVYSCFGYESMNGHLKKMFHGTRQILGQLVFSVKAQQSLSFKCKLLSGENHTTVDFIRQYTTQHPKSSSSGVVFLGKRKRGPLSSSQYQVLIEYTGRHVANIFETAEQIKKGHVYYRTEQDDRAKCSSICTLTDVHGDIHIGSIQKFVVNPSVVLMTPYRRTKYCPAARSPRRPSIKQCIDSISSSLTGFKIQSLQQLTVVPIENIISKCALSLNVVFCLPNNYEHH